MANSDNRQYEHQPVMLEEVLEMWPTRTDGLYVDGTFGRGGHSRALLARLDAGARLVGVDRDPEAVLEGEKLALEDARFRIRRARFDCLPELVAEEHRQIDGLLLDLGGSGDDANVPSALLPNLHATQKQQHALLVQLRPQLRQLLVAEHEDANLERQQQRVRAHLLQVLGLGLLLLESLHIGGVRKAAAGLGKGRGGEIGLPQQFDDLPLGIGPAIAEGGMFETRPHAPPHRRHWTS